MINDIFMKGVTTMSENKKPDTNLKEMLKEIYDGLTDEQKEKAKKCKTTDELSAFAGQEGLELPDEVLDAVAGGIQAGDIYRARLDQFGQPVKGGCGVHHFGSMC